MKGVVVQLAGGNEMAVVQTDSEGIMKQPYSPTEDGHWYSSLQFLHIHEVQVSILPLKGLSHLAVRCKVKVMKIKCY
jgi:hypothetical protein